MPTDFFQSTQTPVYAYSGSYPVDTPGARPIPVDVNNDGHPDIISFPFLFLSDGAGGFVSGEGVIMTGPAPTDRASKSWVVADFNGDGREDVFVGDHGPEDGPPDQWPFQQNLLLLANSGGALENETIRLPQLSDYTYSCAAGDIDGDGDVDIYVGNSFLGPSPYFLLNDGTGQFTRDSLRVPAAVANGQTGNWSFSDIRDLDADGHADLLLGHAGYDGVQSSPSYIFWGDGTGYFTFSNSSQLEKSPQHFGQYYSVFDVNGDGRLDLVGMFGTAVAGNQAYAVQILISNGDRTFSDESARFVDGATYLGRDVDSLHPLDINGDGYFDLVKDWLPPETQEFAFINDGGGYFHAVPIAAVGITADYGHFIPTADGHLSYLVSFHRDGFAYMRLEEQTAPLFIGPDFTDPALSGVPGFNEFYYLRVNPAAAAAVQAGTYATGLAHFLAVGQAQDLRYAANIGTGADEQVIGSDLANHLWGKSGADTLLGWGDIDILDGGDGNDTLDGGAGDDAMTGGLGDDIYVVDSAGDTISELANQGTDTVGATLAVFVLGATAGSANVENLTSIGGGTFLGYGTAGNNVLTGGTGVDQMVALGGADTASLGAGNDYFYAGDGDDGGTGGADVDVMIGEAGNDTMSGGTEQDYLFGGNDTDTLSGEAGVDVLHGEAGNDNLFGGDGIDYFYAGAGNDVGTGGNDVDILVMEAGNDFIYGEGGNDYAYGGLDNDTIFGGAGVDVILGEAGNDYVDGGTDVDYVFLGTGDDTFVMDTTTPGLNVDVLHEFTPGAGSGDILRLLNTGWTTIAQVNAAMFNTGNGYSILTLDPDTQIWLIGILPGQLVAGDVAFV